VWALTMPKVFRRTLPCQVRQGSDRGAFARQDGMLVVRVSSDRWAEAVFLQVPDTGDGVLGLPHRSYAATGKADTRPPTVAGTEAEHGHFEPQRTLPAKEKRLRLPSLKGNGVSIRCSYQALMEARWASFASSPGRFTVWRRDALVPLNALGSTSVPPGVRISPSREPTSRLRQVWV
jgi:hypothetical protein